MTVHFDLFGEPYDDTPAGRGRPPHSATPENRNKVNMLLALGWGNERIAAALRITPPTLRKHYVSEMKYRDVARDRLDMRRAELLWKEVEAGNVGAMKEFARLLEQNDLMQYGQTQRPRPTSQPKTEKLGKKEAQRVAAKNPDAGSTLGQLIAQRQGQVN